MTSAQTRRALTAYTHIPLLVDAILSPFCPSLVKTDATHWYDFLRFVFFFFALRFGLQVFIRVCLHLGPLTHSLGAVVVRGHIHHFLRSLFLSPPSDASCTSTIAYACEPRRHLHPQRTAGHEFYAPGLELFGFSTGFGLPFPFLSLFAIGSLHLAASFVPREVHADGPHSLSL